MRSESIRSRRHGRGVFSACSGTIAAACLCLFCLAQPARAEIVASGDVQPADPATWTSSTDAYIGKTANGTLDITNEDAVTDHQGYIGYGSGSTGEVTVDGAGSTWNSPGLWVGRDGDGTLNITGGGAVSSDSHAFIGYGPVSTGAVTLDGAGSTWTNSSLYIGCYGSGTLSITGGGAVSSSSGYIGRESGSTGEVTVDGAGSLLRSTNHLYVGDSGSGTLSITGGGTVTVGPSTSVASNPGSSGAIHFDDGTLTTGGLVCGADDLTGTGTINTGGLVSDVDLVFDATHGTSQTFTINDNPGQDIT
ncbi:MAG: hypothetical protein ACYS5V_07120, partial [Planctomycetota bacterium]